MKAWITKKYGEKTVFENFEIELCEGEVTCILGASGVGKTTLLRIVAGLESFDGWIENSPKKCAFVFQEPRLLPNLTVAENLRFVGGKDEVIDGILEKTEMLPHKDKRPKQLSGGEKQRVAFARAFAVEADTLLLDEPFSSLDTALKIRLWNIFAALWAERKPTVVTVTHDLEEAWAIGHRIVLIREGKIALDMRPKRSAYPTPYGENSEEKQRLLQALLEN